MLEEFETDMLCKIGCKIRKERTRLKISQAQLAFEVKTDGRHIRRIEKGEVNMSFVTLYRISISLECSIQDLING